MKIVVVGGTGRIGSNLVNRLRSKGHDAVPVAPKLGVDTITGEGLAAAFAGAQVVVDVTNSPSFEDKAVLDFFETSTRNQLAAEVLAGVGHHVALSVIGSGRNPDSGYLRAKAAQERLIKASAVPYTILQATQFFEFVDAIIQSSAEGGSYRLPPALFQPIASDDVAAALADLVVEPPANRTVEVAGPESIGLDAIARQVLAAKGEKGEVITDHRARYFGTEVNDASLRPSGQPRLGPTRFEDWLKAQLAAR